LQFYEIITNSFYRFFRLMSNALLSTFNLCGRGTKIGILGTKVYQLIEGTLILFCVLLGIFLVKKNYSFDSEKS